MFSQASVLFITPFLLVKLSINLVALATAINVDGLELGLGGDGHGGLDLDAEIS